MKKTEETAVVLSEKDQYTILHNEIVQCGSMATTCFVQFMAKLKAMRDGKLYRAVGIETFEQYVEDQVGMKRSQAYKYITVYEKLPLEFVHSSGQIGITKLALLAPLDETEREQLMEEVDVESATVKELKQAIADRDQQIEEQAEQLSERDLQISEQSQQIFEQAHELQELDKLLGKKNQQMEAITAERNELAQQKATWQSSADEINKMTEQLQKVAQEKQKLEQQIKELKNAPAKVETVDNPETVKALQDAQKQIQALEKEQKELTKKLALANDETMSRFKSKFDDFQTIGRDILDLLSEMDGEKAAKCKDALKAVVGGWQL